MQTTFLLKQVCTALWNLQENYQWPWSLISDTHHSGGSRHLIPQTLYTRTSTSNVATVNVSIQPPWLATWLRDTQWSFTNPTLEHDAKKTRIKRVIIQDIRRCVWTCLTKGWRKKYVVLWKARTTKTCDWKWKKPPNCSHTVVEQKCLKKIQTSCYI